MSRQGLEHVSERCDLRAGSASLSLFVSFPRSLPLFTLALSLSLRFSSARPLLPLPFPSLTTSLVSQPLASFLALVVPHDDGWAVRVDRVRLAHCARLRVAAAVERRDPRKERKRRRTRALGRAVQHRLFSRTAIDARAHGGCSARVRIVRFPKRIPRESRESARARAGRTVAGRPLSRIARRNSDQRALMATVRRGHIEE